MCVPAARIHFVFIVLSIVCTNVVELCSVVCAFVNVCAQALKEANAHMAEAAVDGV